MNPASSIHRRIASLALAALCWLGAGLSLAAPKRQPWSFAPLTSPAIPKPANAAWAQSEIDRFVLAKLEQRGLTPNPDANRYALIRRAAFDLTGLPPTEGQIIAFVKDTEPTSKAFSKVVDGYLKSPRFGERWARHWLDVARYADSVGNIWNAPFVYAGRYRNYVIDAYNQDKPFARFVTEQVAGDLLPAKTVAERRANLTATGFLALGSVDLTEGGYDQAMLDRIDDQIDATMRGFLGLTVACARCHDHKYDPIDMRAYYGLAGIFYSSRTYTGQAYRARGTHQYVDLAAVLRLPTKLSNVGAASRLVAGRKNASTQQIQSSAATGMAPLPQPSMYAKDGQRQFIFNPDPNAAMGVTQSELVHCAIRLDGERHKIGPEARRGEFRVPGLPPLPPAARGSSGRLELAHWIASDKNPLPARVYVNRIWGHLMGRPLVETVDDFGVNSAKPAHAELLDHLASQFVATGGSSKRLIRSIMLSRVYQLSSAGNAANAAKDGDNQFHWRMNLRRLELEPLRDSLMFVGGTLKSGPPPGLGVAGSGGKGKYGRTRPLLDIEAPYRTIYLPVLRSLLPEIYGVFDFPDPAQIQGRRDATNVPTQGLFMMNSPFVYRSAATAADRLLREKGLNRTGRIRLTYLRLLGRPASDSEIALAESFMRSLRPPSGVAEPDFYRWTAFVQSLMAGAEFRYLL